MNQDQISFNQKMDRFIKAMETVTQDQVEAFTWIMGSKGWTKENIIKVFEEEKHTEEN